MTDDDKIVSIDRSCYSREVWHHLLDCIFDTGNKPAINAVTHILFTIGQLLKSTKE